MGETLLRRHSKIVIPIALGLAAASRAKGKTGTILGLPYDWRRPTIARAKSRLWNPNEPRVFVPRVFGIGWDINFARVFRRPAR
jgi:uncharacterized membrane protein